MEYQSSSDYQNIIVTGDAEQGNTVIIMQVINELREKINQLQCEMQDLKERKTAPIDSLFQEDLNKIKTGMKVCSNAIQSTNDLFKTSDKKNTEISNELKAFKREVIKCFDEEKDIDKRRIEIFDSLNEGMEKLRNRTKQLGNEIKNVRDVITEKREQASEGMQKLQNRTKQLGNEIKNTRDDFRGENKQINERMGKLQSRTEQLVNEMKNVRDGLKATSSATQSTKDLLKNSDKRITETLNEVRALEKEISSLSVRTETLNDDSFVKKEDLTKVRNGVLNVFSRGIQQASERSKYLDNAITNVGKKLKNQQQKVNTVEQSISFLKNQHKATNEKQAIMENSIKQFSSGIQKLQSELKTEQQKSIILENKVVTFECHLNEILKNCIKENLNKEIPSDKTSVTSTTPKDFAFAPRTCELKISNPQTKAHGQMDTQSKFSSHDYEWIDIVPKGHDNVNFNEEVKSKYSCEEVNQKSNNKEECRDSLTQKVEAFYEKESNASSVNGEIDELTENQYGDLAFDSSSGKEGALLYLEKAHAYLQNLQMGGMFPLSDEESLSESNKGSSVSSDLGDDSQKGMPLYLSTFFFRTFSMLLSARSSFEIRKW